MNEWSANRGADLRDCKEWHRITQVRKMVQCLQFSRNPVNTTFSSLSKLIHELKWSVKGQGQFSAVLLKCRGLIKEQILNRIPIYKMIIAEGLWIKVMAEETPLSWCPTGHLNNSRESLGLLRCQFQNQWFHALPNSTDIFWGPPIPKRLGLQGLPVWNKEWFTRWSYKGGQLQDVSLDSMRLLPLLKVEGYPFPHPSYSKMQAWATSSIISVSVRVFGCQVGENSGQQPLTSLIGRILGNAPYLWKRWTTMHGER